MPVWLEIVVATLALYGIVIAALVAAGRRTDARAVAGFVPDCLVLGRRLASDPRVPARRKALLAFLVAYLACPIDLVPDVIPVAGQLDDAIVVVLVLRLVLGGSPELLEEHWPGPPRGLALLRRATVSPWSRPRRRQGA